MIKRIKVHYLGNSFYTLCGIASPTLKTTSNPVQVTCKNCLREIQKKIEDAVQKHSKELSELD